MSKFTTEVRYICESSIGLTQSVGADQVDEVLEKCWDKVVNFDFPIFDEAYRKVLVKKILKHFYTREIGLETVGLWKLKLNTKLNEIMPYYNKLYETETLEFNPLYNRHLERTTRSDGTTTNDTKTSQSGRNVDTYHDKLSDKYSDTPQGTLGNIEDDTYLTNATIREDASTRTYTLGSSVANTGTIGTVEDYTEMVNGYEGVSGSKMIKEYRDILLNIDMKVINELEDLFFQLW